MNQRKTKQKSPADEAGLWNAAENGRRLLDLARSQFLGDPLRLVEIFDSFKDTG